MHKKILSKFNKVEKNFGEDFVISKNSLYSLILHKKFTFKKISLISFLKNLILIILSLITIFLCKLKKIKVANYFIVHRNDQSYDNRSKYILKNFNFEKSLNIIRCESFKKSISVFFLFPNVIFFLPINFFNTFFLSKKKTLKENYKILHKKELRNFCVYKFIFKYLSIKKFMSIDDMRTMQLFLKICKELNIISFGYMHFKFSKYFIATRYLSFDYFFVWSNYFKKKLLEVNKNYKDKKIFITGYRKKKNLSIKNKKIKVLYLLDLDINFYKTTFLIKKINQDKKIELFFKLKPQHQTSYLYKNFCDKENIKYFEKESLDQINKIHKFDYFIATISTALLEATLYKAIPIKLMTENDFADDLVKDKVVLKASNFNDVLRKIKSNKNYRLNFIFNKVWGKKKFNDQSVKKILLKNF